MPRAAPLLALLALGAATPALAALVDNLVEYDIGDDVPVECRNEATGEWEPMYACAQTQEPLTFKYGRDELVYCGLHVDSEEEYARLSRVIQLKETWNCRVAMTSLGEAYVPFTVPVWGVVEPDHIHMDNHYNFAFHADRGRIIGVSMYPVRDKFQSAKVGSTVSVHGSVSWFERHSFAGMSSTATRPAVVQTGYSEAELLAFALLAMMATLVALVLVYQRRLKPALIRRYMKKD